MSTNEERLVLITGATGNQGGAVARHLIGKGFKLRAMTRKPAGDAAVALAKQGVEVVEGDFDNNDALNKALTGAWGVFSVQNTWEAGVAREEEQGNRIARLAREKNVQHFVYTSVGSAQHKTGIPHFDNKSRIEDTIRGLGFPSYSIIRPVFFIENLVSAWFLNGDKLATALKPDTKLQMIATDDIGRIGAQMFIDAEKNKNREVDLAGDVGTMAGAVSLLSRAKGKAIEFVQLPIEAIRKNSEDFAVMLEWFERVGYSADIAALDKEFGQLTKIENWVQKNVHA